MKTFPFVNTNWLCSFLLLAAILFAPQTTWAQCPNDNTLASANNTVTCGTGLQTIATGISGGQYIGVNVVIGKTYTFETCGLSDAGFDTEMTIYREFNGALLGHDDDACGTDSRVTFSAAFTGAVRVLIDVSGCTSNTAETGIAASCGVANDICANAAQITCGSVTPGTTIGAEPDFGMQSCGVPSVLAPGVFYNFTGVDGTATILLDNCAGATLNKLRVYSGTCTFQTCVAAEANACGIPLTFNTTAGVNYLVYVTTGGVGSEGNFTISLTCDVTNPPPVPANDDCANATPITCGSTTAGTTVGATPDFGLESCGVPSVLAPGVFYSFTGAGGTASILLEDCFGNDFHKIRVYSGSCSNEACVAALFSACGTPLTFNTTAGVDYLVYVATEGVGLEGDFDILLTCSGPPPPPAPANDLCANAIPITCPSTTQGTTIGATADSAPNCGGSGSTPGVWYFFNGNGLQVTMNLCTGTTFDTKLQVFSGSCGALTCVTGNDNACGSQSEVTFLAVNGAPYFVLVSGAVANDVGPFSLFINCALPPAPANDLCANATPISCGDVLAGTTVNATFTAGLPICNISAVPTPDVWYSFVGDGGSTTVSTCLSGSGSTVLRVFSGGCTGLTCVASNDNAPNCGQLSEVTFATTAGEEYLINVFGLNFTLSLECAPPPAPANDLCANPTPIQCGQSISGTTTGATVDPNTICGILITAPGVWYSFVGTGGAVTLDLCSGTNFDTKLSVFQGDCGALLCAVDNDDFCGTQSAVTFNSIAGTLYKVLVHGVGNESGDFSIHYICEETFPDNETATVACPALAVAPTPPTYFSPHCFFDNQPPTPVIPTGPVVTEDPNPLTCEGTRTFTYTYTDCVNNVNVWSFTYTVDQNFQLPPIFTSSTVACLALATPPTPITLTTPCGDVMVPTGPVIEDDPDPLTCEGTRTFIFTYHDCQGNTFFWGHNYTIERLDFAVPANGAATVACPALAIAPAPPTVTSNCGEVLTPTGPTITNVPTGFTCEGTRTFTWTFTDCEGNTHLWSFVYTIERLDFAVPANGAATVACPALAIAPAPPTVTSNCGEVLTPTGPVVTNVPTGFTCEGTRTFTWTFTDCEGNTHPWSFVYTIERQPFAVPANGASTVACPLLITQPTPPVVQSNCGETLTPTGPVIVNSPNPITCEGSRTFTWTFTDCEGNTLPWSHVTTVERQPFSITTPNGSATVACPDQTDVQPTPPVVLSNCGEVLTPVLFQTSAKPGCEGDRLYTFRYTDCEGNTADWFFSYHVEYQDFAIPPSETASVECPDLAIVPVPPTIFDNCGKLLVPAGPVVTSTPNVHGCEATRVYAFTYSDCEGNAHVWRKTFQFEYTHDFFAPADEVFPVNCLAYAVAPFSPTIYDCCHNAIPVTLTSVTEDIAPGGCTGWRKFAFLYTDCGGHSHPWSFTYQINDNEAPLGVCPSGNGAAGPVAVNVTNLACIEEVPCPDDYDFSEKIEALLEAGNYFDICSGSDLVVNLDSWTDLWQCADLNNDGHFTFGRTFYFRIADPCGNEYPDVCAVTFSGDCLPITTFRQEAWGVAGNMPGNSISVATTDLNVIANLLSTPVVIGGSHRSLSVSDPQCIVDLLPGLGGPAKLANCHQTNCTGCNPMGSGGMKNSLAANAIALVLNLRYNNHYNGLTIAEMRNQSLGCSYVHPCILSCDASGACQLRMFDDAGNFYLFPYTIGGLLDMANLYLDGGLQLSIGQEVLYATALNESLGNVNAYWNEGQVQTTCEPSADAAPLDGGSKPLPNEKTEDGNPFGISLAPNPATRYVTLKLGELDEERQVRLEIYNSLGQRRHFHDFGKVASVHELIGLDDLEDGMYIVVVRVGYRQFAQKLFVSKEQGVIRR